MNNEPDNNRPEKLLNFFGPARSGAWGSFKDTGFLVKFHRKKLVLGLRRCVNDGSGLLYPWTLQFSWI